MGRRMLLQPFYVFVQISKHDVLFHGSSLSELIDAACLFLFPRKLFFHLSFLFEECFVLELGFTFDWGNWAFHCSICLIMLCRMKTTVQNRNLSWCICSEVFFHIKHFWSTHRHLTRMLDTISLKCEHAILNSFLLKVSIFDLIAIAVHVSFDYLGSKPNQVFVS